MKLLKQLLSFLLIITCFALFNGGMYLLLTVKSASNFGTVTHAKMIEVENYLPFDDNSEIVKTDASFKITEQMPVLDGATALLPIYSAFAHAVYPENSCPFNGEAFEAKSSMQYRNTVGAYRAVVDGDADLIFCAAPSAKQREYAEQKGVSLELVPIGREAFVFLVNKNNPVSSLTQQQIRDIYGGKITNWKEVGGTERQINPLTRPEGSGSQTSMLIFMGDTPIQRSTLGVIGGSIGFSFRYYVEGIVQNGEVKMVSVDGVYPSAENIRNESYPIVSNFYAVYRKDNPNPNIKPMLEWIISDEGQQIINQTGYVGLK